MGCYSSLGGLHSQVLHFYVLVFPINIQKCLVITRLGFIYMQSASVPINCSGKVTVSEIYLFIYLFQAIFSHSLLFLLFIPLLLFLIIFNQTENSKNEKTKVCLHERFA